MPNTLVLISLMKEQIYIYIYITQRNPFCIHSTKKTSHRAALRDNPPADGPSKAPSKQFVSCGKPIYLCWLGGGYIEYIYTVSVSTNRNGENQKRS